MTQASTPNKGTKRTIGMILVIGSGLLAILATLVLFKDANVLWTFLFVAIMAAQLSHTPTEALNQGIASLLCNIVVLAIVFVMNDPVFILLLLLSAIITVNV